MWNELTYYLTFFPGCDFQKKESFTKEIDCISVD